MTLEERLRRLEDDRAIRDLKARYLRACDTKDPEGLRDSLLPEGAVITFEGFPPLSNRDDFVALYAEMGCAPGIFDIHHGASGIISFESEQRATGKWSLYFHNINLAARSLTQIGAEYQDLYVKQDGRWWIAETRTTRNSCLIQMVDDAGALKTVALGEAPAVFGETG